MEFIHKYQNWLVVLVGVLAGVALMNCWQKDSLPITFVHNQADVGFAQDMSVHHQQAVEMSYIIREQTDNEEIRSFAFDIINTQTTQRGMMFGWLDLWGESMTNTSPMVWMGEMNHSQHIGGAYMMGMATKEELDNLRIKTGKEAEKIFLELMIRHHIGGVMMAEGLLGEGINPLVSRLAKSMVNGQQAEIEYMEKLLRQY